MAKTKTRSDATERFDPNWTPGEGFTARGLIPWKPEKPGERFHGTYLETVEVTSRGRGRSKKEKDTFKSHHFAEFDTGEIVIMSGASLDRQLDGLPQDTECWVVYQGMVKTAGNRQMKGFQVYVPKSKGRAARKST